MLKFDEKKHEYTLDGRIIPSVTTITSVLSNFVYKDIDPFVLEKAALKGTLVHKAIEDYELWGYYELPAGLEPYMQQYLKAKEEIGFEVLHNEMKLHNTKYAGTIDCIAKYKNEIVVIDFKTTTIIHDNLVKPQLSAYQELCEYNGMLIDNRYVLQLTMDDYNFKKIDYEMTWFYKCYEIWEYMQNEKNSKRRNNLPKKTSIAKTSKKI